MDVQFENIPRNLFSFKLPEMFEIKPKSSQKIQERGPDHGYPDSFYGIY